ncbi:protein Jumonji [Ceratina calcarata]|uniref:Protein Jumonji n=1 Tax=Ceratina calcarata TaxID=156304 RepID=A0AAJ7J122_9HYME|nr:protein Jumonji [Ceratina calcarata]XP_017881508.1 protein Jumonji [Ceratina calcarata]
MVLNRNDKRKRKEGDLVDLMEPLSESPKRTKVHAQRKFAQGASTVFNSSHTPIKDKEKSKPAVITELITHKRPNTEDFLTFLCFRGTSILPPSLNFFNVGNKKEKEDPKPLLTSTDKIASSTSTSAECQKSDSSQKNVTKTKPVVAEKKKAPNEIQNNITTFKCTSSTVQALKKKYQEQRLAKQRIRDKFKRVMRTRSCTERTLLKSANKLAPKKFLPRVETKRLGLRSSVLSDKRKKVSPNVKSVLKPKKKIVVKQKASDTSNTDSTSEEEEEVPSEKSQSKRTVQKAGQKNMCTRSKPETRRITRSHSGTVSPKNICRRPTRKTKEAAAVYMEILGRKLVSPDLENDDNVSVDSFPELPNTRKASQAENETKTKVKQSVTKAANKNKESKVTSANNTSNKRLDKTKTSKVAFKGKRLMRVLKYCEIDSDEESVSSNETSNARPVTRRSLGKLNKPANRALRSSTKNLVGRMEIQNTVKSKTQLQNNLRFNKEKFVMKRKREQSLNKPISEKTNEVKQKETKAVVNESTDSDEETLGMLLNKLKRKKDDSEQKESTSKNNDNDVGEKVEQPSDGAVVKTDVPKISDDEESFRGFSKKAISKVLNSCQTHVNANLLTAKNTGNKSEPKVKDEQDSNATNKQEDKGLSTNEPSVNTDLATTVSMSDDQSTQKKEIKSKLPDKVEHLTEIQNTDKKCPYKTETPSANILDMSLAALHVRKEKVNMSTEQIEKWLNESSLAKEESKLEMENVSTFKYEVCEKKADVSHLSISTKIQHLVRPVNVTLCKLAEKSNLKDRTITLNKHLPLAELLSDMKQQNEFASKIDLKDINKGRNIKSSKDSCSGEECDGLKIVQNLVDGSGEKKLTEKKIFQPRKPFLPKVKERKTAIPNANAFSPENESSVYAFESDTEDPVNTPFRRKARESNKSNIPLNSPEIVAVKNENNTNKSETNTNKLDNNIIKFENISSIEKSEIEMNKPLKKEVNDNSEMATTSDHPSISLNNDDQVVEVKNTSTAALNVNKFELPKNFATLANIQVLPLDKLTTNWSNVSCSTSIAVQVNLDNSVQTQEQTREGDANQQRSTEISTQTDSNNENDDENDGQLFYIPLQAVTRNGPNLIQGQQLIQGVAVKLGTEGPTGPNQKVLLRAKLVTKPPSSVVRCPPVGTVQPTTRTPPNSTFVAPDHSMPSTSSNTAPIIPKSDSEPKLSSPKKSESTIQMMTRQNVATASNATQEKYLRSPKTSRERKTSIDSNKNGKRCQVKAKQKVSEICSPTNNVQFPNAKDENKEAHLVQAPTFHPSEKDFQDPLEYIDKIRPIAEKFGICRVIPPPNFKPECKVTDDMRFTAYNQYVHRMLHRWGPNVKEMMAIKKYLATQSITLTHPPWIGGMEVDLPHLYQTVQSLGGLKEVIEKKKWQKVADGMKIPKSAQDRVTKLDDIYCKYLLPYDTLSPEERGKLFNEVESEWMQKESRVLQRQNASVSENEDDEDEDSSDEIEECIVKGRNMPLNAFYRIARNTQRMWFGENQKTENEAEGASADEVESAFWKHVAERRRHVCVHAASIDSSGRGFGFSVAKNSPFARHPWNLKVLTNNAGSVLRALGPIMGVTVPTLHVGMLFSACCWYRDPHGLPWIEYLHTGAKKIWYGIPDEHNNNFREALSKMVPRYCKNKTIWLPSDTAMVPPELLVRNGVSLCQTVQEPGQFIIVFPKAFTSSICTGYVVSESVYFAQSSWLETAEQVFRDIQDSCEPSIFSFERLLFNIINDSRSHIDVLKQIMPSVIRIRDKEISCREQLKLVGLMNRERLPLPDSGKRKKGQRVNEDDGDFECETCRANLFVSLVSNSQDDSVYCLSHALQLLNKKKQLLKHCTLMYTYSEEELDDLIHKLEDRIEAKSKKTNQIKQTK